MRPDPSLDSKKTGIIVKPIASLLIFGPECIDNPLVCDCRELLRLHQRSRLGRVAKKRCTAYSSQGIVVLLENGNVAVFGPLSVEKVIS